MNVLELRGLSVSIGATPILRDVDLTVGAGEAVGLVGESGSGKSMTLRTIARLLPAAARPTGSVSVKGTDVGKLGRGQLRALRTRDLGYVFQDPRAAVNPMHRVRDFLTEVARDQRLDVRAATSRAVELLTRMGVPEPERRLRQYPGELSGGLLQRVVIAASLMNRPALLLADEPTTALDVTTQSDVLALVDELRREQGTAMVFVTHDLDLALAVCDRVVVLYAGQVMEIASSGALGTAAVHPYTRGLFASRPPLDQRLEPLPMIDGVPAGLADVPIGCPFQARCPLAQQRCRTDLPPLRPIGDRRVRCHRAEEIVEGTATGLSKAGAR
jgi:oligopeptide/dipeptide ABC transporter ATP-binding protein